MLTMINPKWFGHQKFVDSHFYRFACHPNNTQSEILMDESNIKKKRMKKRVNPK